MYAKDGQTPPMTGWTGLWLFPGAILLIPAIVWFVKVQRALNRYWEGKTAPAPAAQEQPAV
jgi:cytochrome c-type biogenesis protein CcmH/NrfF